MKYALLSLISFLAVTFLYTLPSFYIYDIHKVKYINDTLVFLEDKFSRLMPSAVVVDPKQVFMAHNPKTILKITADFNFADLASKVCYNSEYQPICTQTALFFEYDGKYFYADHFGNFWIGTEDPFRIDASSLWKSYRLGDFPVSVPLPVAVAMQLRLPFSFQFRNAKYTLYTDTPTSFYTWCGRYYMGCSFSLRKDAYVFTYKGKDSFSPFVFKNVYKEGKVWYKTSYYCFYGINHTFVPAGQTWAWNSFSYIHRWFSPGQASFSFCFDYRTGYVWSPYNYYFWLCYITTTDKPNVIFYSLEDFSGAYYCGDHICSFSAGENKENCPEDCSFKTGDGICQVNIGENYGNSPDDCLFACGDGYCSPRENSYTCPEDCADICGDHFCNPNAGEDCHTCPADCGPCRIICGDGICAYPNETIMNCPVDCKPICGDGYCSESEDPISCPSDCPGAYSKNDRIVSSLLSALLLAQTAFLGGRKL